MMKKKTLKFNDKGKFKILVVSDLHESVNGGNKKMADKTEDTLLLLEASVKALSPDLVVFNGDTVYGNTLSEIEEAVENVTKTVRDRNIPFAVVCGNEEYENNNISAKEIMNVFAKYDDCLYRNDDNTVSGNGNYYISVKGKSNKTKFNLWFMDTGAKTKGENKFISEYDWVKDDQIEWYEKTSGELKEKNGTEIPAILFQHLPVTEIYKLLKVAKPSENGVSVKGNGTFSGKNYVLTDGVKGSMSEAPCPPDYNNGQFDSWKKTGDIKAAFFSHNNLNDFEGEVDGILLAECKGSGFNRFDDGDRTGVKLITLIEDELPEIKTADYYFRDFGLTSKSVAPINKAFSKKQKNAFSKWAKIGIGVAAVTATAVAVKKKKK